MKKSVTLVLCILMGMLFVASMAFATNKAGAGLGIKFSEHDLSTSGAGKAFGDLLEQGTTSDGGNRICIYCHAPHHTMKAADADGIAYIPLWNHAVTVQDYVMYSNGSELPNNLEHQSQAMVLLAGKTKPGSVSRLCLSCHDGTVSTNSYGFSPAPARSIGASGVDVKGTQYLIGGNGDLSNHHPIGFNYAAVSGTDKEIADSSVLLVGSTSNLSIKDLLWQGNMECTTCHDVHNTKNNGERFLWISDAGSDFCMTCHLKKK